MESATATRTKPLRAAACETLAVCHAGGFLVEALNLLKVGVWNKKECTLPLNVPCEDEAKLADAEDGRGGGGGGGGGGGENVAPDGSVSPSRLMRPVAPISPGGCPLQTPRMHTW